MLHTRPAKAWDSTSPQATARKARLPAPDRLIRTCALASEGDGIRWLVSTLFGRSFSAARR